MKQESYKNPLPLVEGEGRRKTGPVMGVDVHKKVLAYCITTEKKILAEEELTNDSAGRVQLIRRCRHYRVRSVAMEATSQYHFPLMLDLVNEKIPCLVANPQQTKNTQGKKTDRLDARRIAVAHRDGRLKPSVIPPRIWLDLRKNTRRQLQLIQEQTKIKQRLQQLFHMHDFEIKTISPKFLTTQWTLDLFYTILTTPRMISEVVEAYYPRRKTKHRVQHQTRITKLTTALTHLKETLSPTEKQLLLTQVLQLRLNRQLQDQHRLTNYLFAKHQPQIQPPLQSLLSTQGIGPDTAYVLLAELVDIRYFPTPQALVKWAGLAPRVFQSGQSKQKTGRIHKGGNKYVRRALTLVCTNIYARGDPHQPIYRLIKAKYQETGKYWLAICAGARKLLVIIWYLLQTNQLWNPPDIRDPQIRQHLQAKIQRKIQAHTRQIERCEKLQQRLTESLGQQLDAWPTTPTDPNRLLRDLLKLT